MLLRIGCSSDQFKLIEVPSEQSLYWRLTWRVAVAVERKRHRKEKNRALLLDIDDGQAAAR